VCGIAGVYRRDGVVAERALVRRLTAAMAHRGPDGEGHADFVRCSIGAVRFAILGSSTIAAQPTLDDDRRVAPNHCANPDGAPAGAGG